MTLLKTKGFTLVELMIGVAISSIVFAAMVAAMSSLEKCLLASNQYSQATGDEQRVMDYVSRDLRGAYTVALSSSSQTLALTIPDYYGGNYDAQGNPTGSPVTPVIVKGVVYYGTATYSGTAAKPLTVTYYVSGSNLIRQQTVGVTGSQSQVIISNDVENLQTNYVNLTSVVQLSVTFLPIYQWGFESSSAQAGTTLTAIVSIRNLIGN